MGRSLIDTSILIEAERGRLDLNTHIESADSDGYYISVITVSEVLHGVYRATPDSLRIKRSAIVEMLLDRFSILDIDQKTARFHARLSAELQMTGSIIGPHDMWIAATCLAHRLEIVTANLREFRRVPGLEVTCWSRTDS